MAYTTKIDPNDGTTIIVTTQAPDALPIGKTVELSTAESILISVPKFEVPELVFGGSTTIEPGIGEVISPLILTNKTANTTNVDVKIYRFEQNVEYFVIRNLPIPAYDTIPIPLNGQFFATGDELKATCEFDYHVDATISFTIGQAEEYDVD
jgi:hypothetical protein